MYLQRGRRRGSTPRAAFIFDGDAANYLSGPHLGITGDLDVSARIAPDAWATGSDQALCAEYDTAGNNRSWRFDIAANGRLQLFVSTDGITFASTSASPAAAVPQWVRVTRVAATGATTFYTAPDSDGLPATWAVLGTPGQGTNYPGGLYLTAGRPVLVGRIFAGGGSPFAGRIRRVVIRDGIGGPVLLDIHDRNARHDRPTFTTPAGQTITEVGDVIAPAP